MLIDDFIGNMWIIVLVLIAGVLFTAGFFRGVNMILNAIGLEDREVESE